jgi:hypothetical protein
MSGLGHEQTSRHVCVMSVIPLKADIHQRGLHVRLVPRPDMLASGAGVDAAVTLAPVTCRSENSELVDLHRRRPAQHLPGDIARHAALARGRGVLVDG